MADCITTRHPKGTFRRTSVTQGTISSMAKEVVKPYTSKSQRTQQQKNLNRVKSPKNLDHSQSLLRASIRDSQQQNETVQVKQTKKHSKKRRSGAKMTVPRSVPHSVDFRLDTASLGTMHLQQHNMTPTLSENDIVSCGLKEPWTIHQRDWIPPSPEEEEEEEDSGGSSSASSISANFTSSKSNELSIAPLLSDCSKQVIIENLDSSFRTYSNQVKGILENPGTTDKPFIQECRSLIYQQNSLLNQLETFSDKKKVISTVSSSQTSLKEDILVTSLENTWSNFTQLFQTSGVTIHKKVNDPNSIVAVVKGTGTTLLTEYVRNHIPFFIFHIHVCIY
jgi:hypothetical protein